MLLGVGTTAGAVYVMDPSAFETDRANLRIASWNPVHLQGDACDCLFPSP